MVEASRFYDAKAPEKKPTENEEGTRDKADEAEGNGGGGEVDAPNGERAVCPCLFPICQQSPLVRATTVAARLVALSHAVCDGVDD